MDDPASLFSVENKSLDESLLSGDTGEVYLFQWLSSVERFLKSASPEDIKSVHKDLETTLINVITVRDPYPLPGRALRNLVASCFLVLYTRGESKTLFDALLAFLKTAGDFKALPDREPHKIASLYCIGELMGTFGAQVMSFMTEIATVALKTYRSSNSISLRYHAVVALRKSLSTARRAATDSVARDVIKQMKHGLNDKSLPIRRAASEALVVMYPLTGTDWTASEIESVVALCVKSLDSADQITRHSLAQLVGTVLSSSQAHVQVAAPEPSKKSNKREEGEDDDPAPVAAPTGETKTLLTLQEMLHQLSAPLQKPQTTHKTRVGIFDFYSALFAQLGSTFIESNYAAVVQHLMSEVVMNPRSSATRYDVLLVRRFVGILLRDLIAVRMLSEQALIGAIQELSNAYLKRWPALMPGSSAPSAHVLAIVLKEVAGLLQQLGNAPTPVQDALSEPLVTLLAHPGHTVRVHASWALRVFCYSSPLRLPKIVINVMELLQRDVNLMTTSGAPSDLASRALGHAYGLAALVTVIPERPLYVSYDISAKVLDMAIQLLKHAGEHDVKLAGVEVEIAWTCIAALMTLGPNFVRAHLPQLLVLWRNALPKPTNKDTSGASGRTRSEWTFLLHVRESALSAILCFLKHNSPALVTLDVARRIATMLSNAFLFANGFASQHVEDPLGPNPEQIAERPSLRNRESLLRRRIFQCFAILGSASVPESTQVTLLQSVISLVASADGYTGSSVQAAIASSSGSFSSLWQTFDGYAYGVTAIQISENAASESPEDPANSKYRLNRDSIEASIDDLLRKPILQSSEYDPLSICQTRDLTVEAFWPEFPPADTQAVDAGLHLFARLLPLQDPASASRLMTQIIDSVRSPKFERNVGRKAAVQVNATIAIVLSMRQAMSSSSRQAREVFGSQSTAAALSSFLKDGLVEGDAVLRSASSEAIGRLAGLADNQFLASQMKTLVDQVVNNRDPQGRAGCALALAAIYDHVGSLAAGPLLKTTVNILMSLSKDAHPVVHFWAMHSLSRVINAASLAYAPYVPSTLGMLFKVYVSPSHEPEGGTLANSNISGDLPAYQVACQIIDAVITVLGPDIQESTRSRTLILDLVHRLMSEEDEGIRVEAIKCIQHFLMFAPEHVDVPELITEFRTHLNSSRRPLKLASIHALYQLVQKDALLISKVGGDRLVEELFAMLDGDPSIEGVRNVISSWLQQTVVYNPSAWIDLCQKIMSRTTASQQATDAAAKTGAVFDDEGESLSVGMSNEGAAPGQTRLTSRWRTQLFALRCLHDICTIISRSGRKEQLDIAHARSLGIPVAGLLVSRVPDLIRMAFTASTAYVTEIRLEGLIVLRDVIEIFATAPDPDYEDSLLLEQHQAPITAALTPAFTADSTPEILASAIGACAIFVGCGIVKDVSRMGRILKLLTSALEQCKGTAMLSLGDAGEGSPNASAMLRIATLSAWAQLASASVQQTYLKEVVKPYRATLASLWVAALRDYASIRADSEVMQDTSSAPLDAAYASLGKDILLPYYAESWTVILQAVATAMEVHDSFVRGAMDGVENLNTVETAVDPAARARTEPTTMFFVVFSLVYEALSISLSYAESTSTTNNTPLVALRALKSLVRREYSGTALLEPTIFDELLNLWYRMAMTEPPAVQTHLVETLRVFAVENARPATDSGKTTADLTTTPTVHCQRICAYILKNAIPGSQNLSRHGQLNPLDRINLIKAAFDAFVDIGASLNGVANEEVRAVAISLYGDILKDETSDVDYAGPTLPCLKSLLVPTSENAKTSDFFSRVVHGLLSACLLNIDEMKGRSGAISSNKVKNNFLAAVLILTVIPPSVKVGRGVISRLCFLISEKLAEAHEMALTAAHCAKTLISASASGSLMLRQCARMLLPGMVEYVAKVSGLVGDESAMQSHLPAVGEILKAFGTLFTTVSEELRVRVLGLLLPTMSLLLDPDHASTSPLHTLALTQILSFASLSPLAFKEATGKLDQATRERLEGSVRSALSGKSSTSSAQQHAKPQISLRAF
ncbi:clathrin-coated vesicle protein [Artomyces pyxidatus]|uniref:Clathrin-coated vesicle protein n=1 Tax=Artomyces pyxidatus TaxID=48021 RepID=A0ACB8T3G0_9AGAM|nr:clathrin-coated vesicle protein [Artomyces pyxidatus]